MWTDQQGQPLLTVPEVAHHLRQNEQTVRRLMRLGTIPGAIKLGREWRIAQADLDAFLTDLKTPAA